MGFGLLGGMGSVGLVGLRVGLRGKPCEETMVYLLPVGYTELTGF